MYQPLTQKEKAEIIITETQALMKDMIDVIGDLESEMQKLRGALQGLGVQL